MISQDHFIIQEIVGKKANFFKVREKSGIFFWVTEN